MTQPGDGTPRDDRPPGRRTAWWSLVLGLVTATSIIGLTAVVSGAPRPLILVLSVGAVTCGLGSMALGVIALLPRTNASTRARRQAFAGAVLGSLVLVGLVLVATSALVLDSQANAAMTRFAAQMQRTLQAQQRCISAAQSAGASEQSAFNRCTGSPTGCSGTGPIPAEAVFCTGTFHDTTTNFSSGTALILLAWAALVFAAGWLLLRRRDPPALAGATP